MHYVYILSCSDNTFYTGCTSNLQSRIKRHQLRPVLGQTWSVSEGARQYLVGAGFPTDHSGVFFGAPQGKAIGKLKRQTDQHYFNEFSCLGDTFSDNWIYT